MRMGIALKFKKIRRVSRRCCAVFDEQAKEGFFFVMRDQGRVVYKCGRCLVNEFGILPDEVYVRKRDPLTRKQLVCGRCGVEGRCAVFRAGGEESRKECGRRCIACIERIGV